MEPTSSLPLSNSASAFFPLVSSALLEEWKSIEVSITKEDLNFIIQILAKMAFDSISAYEKELKEFRELEAKSSQSFNASLLTPSDDSSSTDRLQFLLLEAERKSRRVFHNIFGLDFESETTEARIKKYVHHYQYNILKICQTGLPFSNMQHPAIENAIKNENGIEFSDSVVFKYMKMVGINCETEEEVDKIFLNDFQRLDLNFGCSTCSALKRAYLENDLEAGFYLLWFIKKIGSCFYEIPNKKSFNKSTVATILTKFINGNSPHANTIQLLNILFYRQNSFESFLFSTFLDSAAENKLINFAIYKLQTTNFEIWPNKCNILIDVLNILSIEGKNKVAGFLRLSEDAKTKLVGEKLSFAFKAKNLKSALPYYYALQDLNFSKTDIEHLFGRPFENLRDSYYQRIDPSFARRLIFNETHNVFVHKSIIMGVHLYPLTVNGRTIPPYLLAYDMYTEKLLWGLPLSLKPDEDNSLTLINNRSVYYENRLQNESQEYHLSKVGNYIALHFTGTNQINFINAETGESVSTVTLPEIPQNKYDFFYISPKGYAYQVLNKENNQYLIGGYLTKNPNEANEHKDNSLHRESICTRFFNAFASVLNHSGASEVSHETKTEFNSNPLSFYSEEIPKLSWKTTFFFNAPGLQFIPLSTHFGFESLMFEQKIVIFGPSGDQVTLENCVDVLVNDNKLFSLELPINEEEAKEGSQRKSKKSDKIYLVIRSLLEDHQVISQQERKILIHTNNQISSYSLKEICKNNQIILFGSGNDKYPIFVDLNTEQIIYSDHKFESFAKYFINSDTAELWTWDEVHKQVYKVSSQGTQALGQLNSFVNSFLYAKQSEYIYYC